MAYNWGFNPYANQYNSYSTATPAQTAMPVNGYSNPASMPTAVPMPVYSNNLSQGSNSQSPPPQQSNSGFVWVQGEAGARAYPVAAGNSVLLMDSENPVIYMKSSDTTGRPLPMEIYDLVKREPEQRQPQATSPPQTQQIDLSEYVKMNDLEEKVRDLVNKALNE